MGLGTRIKKDTEVDLGPWGRINKERDIALGARTRIEKEVWDPRPE